MSRATETESETEARDEAETGDSFDVGSRLREIRAQHGLTQRELATRAGVAHGLISMIEQNRSSPSVASLRRILGGIGMTMADFFEPDRPQDTKVVFRPSELIDLTSQLYRLNGGNKVGKISLRQVGHARSHNLQILHEHYEPGADTGPTMLEHASHEGGVVISGELELTVGDQVQILKAGDAYLFDSRTPHRFRNVHDRPCEVVSACSPPYL
nr:cupin domain-containing protein [Aureimonas mangrovi]